MIEVRASYPFDAYPAFDKVAHAAAERKHDFSGCGLGVRDLGWVCKSETEAWNIATKLRRIGLNVETRAVNSDGGTK